MERPSPGDAWLRQSQVWHRALRVKGQRLQSRLSALVYALGCGLALWLLGGVQLAHAGSCTGGTRTANMNICLPADDAFDWGQDVRDAFTIFDSSITTAVNATTNASNLTTGTLPNARLDSSSVTLQGNSFNAADKLLKLNGSAQITAAMIPAASIDTDKISGGAVTTAKINDGAVDTAKLATDSVITAKIIAQGVTTPKIADLAVDTGKIATDAVTSAKIIAQGVTTPKIADLAVDTGKLATDSITTAKIIAEGVTTPKLALLAIDTSRLAPDAVTTAKILDENVTTAKIAALAVDTGRLATDAVTTAKVQAEAITTAKVAQAAIDTSRLATDSVVTAKIASENVTTPKIAQAAVDTSRLATDSVVSAKIIAEGVTTPKIAVGAVDTSRLATDAVTTAKILAGAVDTDRLKQAAVTVEKLSCSNASSCPVVLNSSGQYPAFDGSLITNISGALTGGIVNTIPRWLSGNSQGNSNMRDTGSAITVGASMTLSSGAVSNMAVVVTTQAATASVTQVDSPMMTLRGNAWASNSGANDQVNFNFFTRAQSNFAKNSGANTGQGTLILKYTASLTGDGYQEGEYMSVDRYGNFGIGTSTAAFRLHVSSPTTGTNTSLYIDGNATYPFRIGSSSITYSNSGSDGGGWRVVGPSAQTIGAGDTITANACGTVKEITSAGAVTTNTTDTFTAPSADNKHCCMTVINVGSNQITLDNNSNFAAANATDVVLTANRNVYVCSTGAGGKWIQIGPTGQN